MSLSADRTNPIAPSIFVRLVMRPLVAILNPLIRQMAGKRHMSMAALLSHRGRRSGRHYVTPVGAHVVGDDCLIPLTFGSGSDWCKNLQASGVGHVRWRGRNFDLTTPQVYEAEQVQPLIKKVFSPLERAGFKVLGIKGFIHLHAVPAPRASGRTT